METSAKLYSVLSFVVWISLFGGAANAAESAKRKELEKTFGLALLCNGVPVDARDSEEMSSLKKLGVSVKRADSAEAGTTFDIEYRFKTPIIVAGAPVTGVSYLGGKGTAFYAYAKGDMGTFASKTDSTLINSADVGQVGFGIPSTYYRKVAPSPKINPQGGYFFVGRKPEQKPEEFIFGCQRLGG